MRRARTGRSCAIGGSTRTAISPNGCWTESVDRLPPAWVTGANGLIGAQLIQLATQHLPAYTVRGLSRETVDLLDASSVRDLFQKERPAVIVHCAAISRSPVCETDPKLAHRTNVEATRQLAELAAEIPFVFFSSDLVFDGTKGAYIEEDAPNPLSTYAETKALAEQEQLRKDLQASVDSARNEELLAMQVFREMRTQYPLVKAAVIQPSEIYSDTAITRSTLIVLTLSARIPGRDKIKLENWLKVRLNRQDINLIFSND